MNKIKYLSKKKVVVLGSSLPMLLLAYFLYKNKINVQVINDTKVLGGAWRAFKYNKYSIRRQSNVVVPINKKEEKKQKQINSILTKIFKIKIDKLKKKIITPYKFKRKFYYNFNFFLKNISKKKIFKNLKVNKINLNNNLIILNNKFKFDFMFIPTYFGINEINIDNKIIKTDYSIIKSEHIVAIIKSSNFGNIYYSDFFNNFFDRVQFTSQKNFSIFSARITKTNKGSNNKKIYGEIEKIFNKDQIIYIKKFKYKNYYRNYNQILELKKIKKNKSIKYLDTQSLLSFLIEFMKYFK